MAEVEGLGVRVVCFAFGERVWDKEIADEAMRDGIDSDGVVSMETVE